MNENILTTKRIYELAHQKLTELWHIQSQSNDRFYREFGRENEIGRAREVKYWNQLKELEKLAWKFEN